jgi:hypothetical protein
MWANHMIDSFKGVPLTPKLAWQILPDVLALLPQDGSSFVRADFIEKLRYIAQTLGIIVDESKLTLQVKKVLSNAVKEELLYRPYEGALSYIVRNSDAKSANQFIDYTSPPENDTPTSDGLVKNVSSPSNQIEIEQVIGTGRQCVYCYYFPTYKRLAAKEKNLHYPIKIGFSKDLNPDARILSQTSTALPESPIVALLIKTDDSAGLEKIIHSTLSFNRKNIKEARGEEWFLTNAEEIARVVNIILETKL